MGVQEGNFADSKFLSLNLARRWITLTEQFTLEHCPGSSKLAEHVVDFSKFQCNPRRLEWFTTVNLAVEKGEFVEKQ